MMKFLARFFKLHPQAPLQLHPLLEPPEQEQVSMIGALELPDLVKVQFS